MLPGSTGRFYNDDVVHNHSAHRYYITRIEGGVRYARYCYIHIHIFPKKQKWAKKAVVHTYNIVRELDLVTFHIGDRVFSRNLKKEGEHVWATGTNQRPVYFHFDSWFRITTILFGHMLEYLDLRQTSPDYDSVWTRPQCCNWGKQVLRDSLSSRRISNFPWKRLLGDSLFDESVAIF